MELTGDVYNKNMIVDRYLLLDSSPSIASMVQSI